MESSPGRLTLKGLRPATGAAQIPDDMIAHGKFPPTGDVKMGIILRKMEQLQAAWTR